MSELVKRLRARREPVWDGKHQGSEWCEDTLCQQAADEIERLERELAEANASIDELYERYVRFVSASKAALEENT